MPRLVYGTAWKGDRTAGLVYAALRAGFRAVDTAAQPKHYDERAVGEGVRRAVADGLVRREDLFVQTKFTAPAGQNHLAPYRMDAPLVDKVHQSLRSSLANLAVPGCEPYLDSLVLHSPMDAVHDTLTVWRTLESYVPHPIRRLGISNTTLELLELLDANVAVKPAVVQNRFHHATRYDVPLRAFCRDRAVIFQSFWTVSANSHLARSEPVRLVARQAAVEPVAAYYSLVVGLGSLAVLDGTTDEAHMRDDLQGLGRVARWAEGEGAAAWEQALAAFKALVGDA